MEDLTYIPELKSNPDLVKEALQRNQKAMQYADTSLWDNQKFFDTVLMKPFKTILEKKLLVKI